MIAMNSMSMHHRIKHIAVLAALSVLSEIHLLLTPAQAESIDIANDSSADIILVMSNCDSLWQAAQARADQWTRYYLTASSIIKVRKTNTGCITSDPEPMGKAFKKGSGNGKIDSFILYSKEGNSLNITEQVPGSNAKRIVTIATFDDVEFDGIFPIKRDTNSLPRTQDVNKIETNEATKNKYPFDCASQPTRELFNKCMMNM
jgi:hypothetical protein